ncbi:MAG TPA: hypothetical protein VLJ38_00145 [Polyangiaceae bacterium]|nr:hypothetical protein [Polyangiaceae bacterium]
MQARDSMKCMQYTIRKIPPALDKALKARAKQLGKSVNELALEALAQSVGEPVRRRELRRMPGSWTPADAKAFDRFLDEHRQIDAELWK